jgi:hypothetical protein
MYLRSNAIQYNFVLLHFSLHQSFRFAFYIAILFSHLSKNQYQLSVFTVEHEFSSGNQLGLLVMFSSSVADI